MKKLATLLTLVILAGMVSCSKPKANNAVNNTSPAKCENKPPSINQLEEWISNNSDSVQIWYFKTTAFAHSQNVNGSWKKWSNWEDSDMLLTMDLTNDIITIYSPKPQTYTIYSNPEKGYDSDGDYKIVFDFIDQDEDHGAMWLMQRKSGASEIYIFFANIKWCYRVKRVTEQ